MSNGIYYPFQSVTTHAEVRPLDLHATTHAEMRQLDLHAITILTAREFKIVHGNSDVSQRPSIAKNHLPRTKGGRI
jgi:hypothetical protein